jgi:sec-independent protein translocase protein TatB
MPSFQDSALIFFIALLLFGPKKLPELARQLGKLMGEFRRASNEFRMQMDEELRAADQLEQQKKIAAMEAAAPVTPALAESSENAIAAPSTYEPSTDTPSTDASIEDAAHTSPPSSDNFTSEPLPIATSGELNLMPPSTGLPVSNSALSPVLDSIPHTPDPNEEISPTATPATTTTEASLHG